MGASPRAGGTSDIAALNVAKTRHITGRRDKKMSNRRGQGEGSIYKRGDGHWVAVVDLGWQDGQRKRKALYARTQKDALRKLDAARRQVSDGIQPPPEGQRLASFLERWLRDVAHPTLRQGSYERYHQALTLHVIPALGQRVLARLTAQDLQALYSRRLEAGASPNTVAQLHRILHRALRDAVRWGLTPRNVCDLVDPPRTRRKEMRALSADEARQLLQSVHGDPNEALYVLAVTVDMRQGELLALKWADVDLDVGTVQIRRTTRRVKGEGYVESEPKTASGRRNVTLSQTAINALRLHRARQVEQRLAAAYWEDRDLVFTNEFGRTFDVRSLRRGFQAVLRRVGLPALRFHDLRHSAASLLLAQGVNAKVVQEMLGHSAVAFTLQVYSHVVPALRADAADKMDAIFSGRL